MVAGMAIVQTLHHRRFGHFVRYGWHTDIVMGNSDIALNDTYFAHLWNLSLLPADLEGCRLPGGFAGEGILYRWDVQRWNPASQSWNSLRGADTWVPEPFGGYSNDEKCRPEMTHIWPFTGRKVAWVYKDWVTTGDPIRIAIHTSATAPANRQQVIYTEIFTLKVLPAKTFR